MVFDFTHKWEQVVMIEIDGRFLMSMHPPSTLAFLLLNSFLILACVVSQATREGQSYFLFFFCRFLSWNAFQSVAHWLHLPPTQKNSKSWNISLLHLSGIISFMHHHHMNIHWWNKKGLFGSISSLTLQQTRKSTRAQITYEGPLVSYLMYDGPSKRS
jgi:hypothetical protein